MAGSSLDHAASGPDRASTKPKPMVMAQDSRAVVPMASRARPSLPPPKNCATTTPAPLQRPTTSRIRMNTMRLP